MRQKLRYFCTLLLMAVVGVAWADEELAYTLQPASGTNNSYASNCNIEIDGITWNLTGNSTMQPWRIGGKSLTGVDRELYSKTAIEDNITKIEVTHGNASSITINSWTLVVASDASFNSVVSTLTPTFTANATPTITRPDGVDWSGCYYKFIYNVTVSGSSNKFVEFTQAKFYKDAASADAPSITTENVNIEYDATGGVIAYTVNNPVSGGSVNATTTADWLTLGENFESPIAFTCEANETKDARTATVTLTYTYDNESVTKNVTVTQAANPNVIDKIENISESGVFYVVKGTVVATSARAFVIGDGTGYVYTYLGTTPSYNVGDMVKISGTTSSYNQVIQFPNSATITVATESEYTPMTPGAMTEVPDYTSGLYKSDYYQFEGMLTKEGNYYVVAVGEGQIRISYPSPSQTTELDALLNKMVKVNGFFAGNSANGSGVFTAIMESIEEVVSEDPAVTLANYNISVDAEGGDAILTVQYQNIDDIVPDIQFYEEDGTTETTAAYYEEWLVAELDNDNNVNYVVMDNTGEERKAYFKVFALVGEDFVYSDMITITQAAYVAPSIATLPFEFNEGKAAIDETDGLTQEGLGNDYASSPKLRFDTTGDWMLLQFDEEPGKLTFDIKGNSFSGGTFTVQTSEDGVTFTELASYTELGATQNVVFTDLGANVRFIKWIYTEKVSGNVALGNIKLEKPATSATITIKNGFKATTFSCDKALDFTNVEGITANIITDENGTTKEVKMVPANTGLYIVRGDTEGEVSYEVPFLANEEEDVSDNKLIPTDGTEFKSDEFTTYYAFGKQNGKEAFYKVPTSGYTPSANKAVLVVNAPASSAKEMIVIGGDVTGIESIENGTIVNDNYYTIDGKLVKGQPTQKGIYVVNGRKVVIK